MASVYKPQDKKHWYISYIDPDTRKAKNKSTGLLATAKNKKEAERIKTEIEGLLQERSKSFSELGIKRATIQQAYKHFLRANFKKSKKTQYDYEAFFKKLTEKIPASNPCTVLNKNTAEEWILYIQQLKKQPNTIYNYFKVFNKFLNFLFNKSYIAPFKIDKDDKPKPEIKEITIFRDEDLKKIFSNLETLKKTNNFKTFIFLLAYTGLRPSDLLEITVEDIYMKNSLLEYYSPKTDQHLEIPLHKKLLPILRKRIAEVKSGRLIQYATIGEIGKAFRRYLEKIELDGRGYNLRTFRKHFATKAFENGIQVMAVAKLLGHKKISTTMKYYTKANNKKLSEELEKLKI